MFKDKQKDLETVIGKNTQFTGDIVAKGTLCIDGRVVGNVEADWLILGEKSYLKGNSRVGGIVVGGYLEGNVEAREIIEVKSKGQVRGDISTAKLVVLEGGSVDGRVSMKVEGSKVVELNKDKIREAQH